MIRVQLSLKKGNWFVQLLLVCLNISVHDIERDLTLFDFDEIQMSKRSSVAAAALWFV